MRTLHVDDRTYAEWERRARARGLTVEQWLKAKTNGGEPKPGEFDPQDQLARLHAFEARQKDYGGVPRFDRHDLYD